MAENTAFSSAGDDAIARTINVEQEDVPLDEDFDGFYAIDRTVREITRGDYKRVRLALQRSRTFSAMTAGSSSVP